MTNPESTPDNRPPAWTDLPGWPDALPCESARLGDPALDAPAARRQTDLALRRRAAQLEALRSISAGMTRELDLPTLLRVMHKRAIAALTAPGKPPRRDT